MVRSPVVDEVKTPPPRPLEKHARIEADLFCEHCGYNLYTQPVSRDERLGILVVRCPECGKHAPAAIASNATRVWLNRLATIFLAIWILTALLLAAGATTGLSGLQILHVAMFTSGGYFTPEGVEVYRDWDPMQRRNVFLRADNDHPVNIQNPVWRRTFRVDEDFTDEPILTVLVSTLVLLAPLIFGIVASAILWHVPRRKYLLLTAIPILAYVIVNAGFYAEDAGRGGNAPLVAMVAGVALAEQICLIMLGTLLGRPIARFLASLLVPPRPRQALSFLWTADGKSPPKIEPRMDADVRR